jgi:integron integrase
VDIEKKLRERIKMQRKSDSTANAYWQWSKRFLDFCKENKVGKETKAEVAVERFLTHLANVENISANTQNQAFSAICYLYREVLKRPLEGVSALRAKRPDRIRDICDQSEIGAILDQLKGINWLAVAMMYGLGLRIGEIVRVRIKDISFERKQIHIYGGKGQKDRMVQFPEPLHEPVKRQIESMKVLWKYDIADGLNGVSLPDSFGRKSPSSRLEFAWFFLFCSDSYSECPHTKKLYRHHRDESGFSKALKKAVRDAGVTKRITPHCLRHSNGTHYLEEGGKIHDLKELFGHASIETTERYAHVRKDGVTATKSPLETLLANPGHRQQKPKDDDKPFTLRVVG